ncbi:hypothetical protein Lal_00040317 [Lupinus albus]|uniref:Putative transcription factor bHLH family n=1 Tax=Lupinus albus TaxID=3870 RepID=A0A6A4R1H1_LUPAL|nr:putative transcription factor bHLH family [Lupinus albus]KAF1877601.1 hypothetical protein Lal_00040317 [Lupinus albus]
MSIMSLNSKQSYKLSVKRATKRVRKQRRTTNPSFCMAPRSFKHMMKKSKVSQKLHALKNLVPSHNGANIVKPDQLFQETADYIVLLRTRVMILHKLIQFYRNNPENGNALFL